MCVCVCVRVCECVVCAERRDRVDALLRPLGMRCANRPCGWWEYHEPTATTVTTVNGSATKSMAVVDYPEVARCCGVFKCEGDRRLGDHILRGVSLVILMLQCFYFCSLCVGILSDDCVCASVHNGV